MTEGTRQPPIRFTSVDAVGREVRRLASRLWQHDFPSALWLQTFRPRYEVPGRRRNGSVKGERPVRWLLGRLLLPLWSFVFSVISVFFDGGISSVRRSGVVRGEPNCQALTFADANRSEQESLVPDALWLLSSPERAVLCKLKNQKTNPSLEVIWSGEGAAKPHVDGARRLLTWPDGSSVQLGKD